MSNVLNLLVKMVFTLNIIYLSPFFSLLLFNSPFSFYYFQNQISWIRRRDWHILSSGSQLYTNDERFAILHTAGSNVWTLQIKFVQRRDSGMYECQVSEDLHFSFSSEEEKQNIMNKPLRYFWKHYFPSA